MIRDTNRKAYYNAEHQLEAMLDRQPDCPTVLIGGSKLTLPAERKFGDLDSIQRYIDRVLALDVIDERYSPHPVRVRERKGDVQAQYAKGVIAIPTATGYAGKWWAMRETVVLHELAHALTDDVVEEAHGPVFRRAFCDLLAEVMSPEVGFVMEYLFHQAA